MRKVYLDAATSMPVRSEVIDEMLPYMREHYGNPSSIHSMGRKPREALENARSKVAGLINADPDEIVFTSGATESINLSLRGPLPFIKDRKGIVVSQADHRSVRATAEAIGSGKMDLSYLPLNGSGSIREEALEDIIGPETGIVSFPFASYEVGTLQPVKEIANVSRERGALSHVDLTMSALQAPFDVKDAGIDMATISSPDLMGPKGVGALFMRKGVRIASLIKGGGQERGLRSGSENIPGIVGMGKAASIAMDRMDRDPPQMKKLRDRLISGLLEIPDSHLNGDPEKRLPGNVNIRYDYVEGESMLLMLDMNNVSIATGSACAQKSLEASKTLLSMGLRHEQAHGSLMYTLGPYNTAGDIEHVISVMPEIVEELRMMSPIYERRNGNGTS